MTVEHLIARARHLDAMALSGACGASVPRARVRDMIEGVLARPEKLAGMVVPAARAGERYDRAVRQPGRDLLVVLENSTVRALIGARTANAYAIRARALVETP